MVTDTVSKISHTTSTISLVFMEYLTSQIVTEVWGLCIAICYYHPMDRNTFERMCKLTRIELNEPEQETVFQDVQDWIESVKTPPLAGPLEGIPA